MGETERDMRDALVLVRAIKTLGAIERKNVLETVAVCVLQFVYFRRLEWLTFDTSMPSRVVNYVLRVTAREGVVESVRPLPTVIGGWW